MDYYLKKVIVGTTKAVVQFALEDIRVGVSSINLLIMPSLELLGPKLVCIDLYDVVNEDVVDQLDKDKD